MFISDLQKETLEIVDKMIEENKTFNEIRDYLYNHKYMFIVETKNGYTSKTRFSIEKIVHYTKDNQEYMKYENTFVDLIKRRNGLAYWETYRLN